MLNEKRFFSLFISVRLFLGFMIVFGCQGTSAQNNFNGGFEIKSNDFSAPDGWSQASMRQTLGFYNFDWDSTERHSGSYSVSIEITAKHPQDKIAYNWTRTYEEFKIDQKYELSGWIKTKDLKESAWIVVQFWGENQKWIGMNSNQFLEPIKGTTDWTLIKYDFTVPEDTKEVRIRAGIASPINNGGKVWFDDIKIE